MGPWQNAMTVIHYLSHYKTFHEIFIFMELLKVLFGFGNNLKLNTQCINPFYFSNKRTAKWF